ncbi:hypothetical protein RRG08_014128 [Elysia crispata]|uniref:Uncharacterized protein n=1 Tax=Elysia crispata TaxID=231223 RepID=A0AAE1AYY3_9GAST|nr:hypothetical protein RRG08_014128 [Elysia crispata]
MVKQTETVSEFYSPVGNGQFSPGLSEFSQNAGPGFEFPGTRHMKSDVGRQYRLLLMTVSLLLKSSPEWLVSTMAVPSRVAFYCRGDQLGPGLEGNR